MKTARDMFKELGYLPLHNEKRFCYVNDDSKETQRITDVFITKDTGAVRILHYDSIEFKLQPVDLKAKEILAIAKQIEEIKLGR